MSSAVRFAAPMPASRAVTNASPFGPPASTQRGQDLGPHAHHRRRHGAARGHRLVADVDHARRALVVEVARLHRPTGAAARARSPRRRLPRLGGVGALGDDEQGVRIRHRAQLRGLLAAGRAAPGCRRPRCQTLTRRNARRAGVLRRSARSATARTRSRPSPPSPSMARMNGRTNSSNITSALTGLPGRPMTVVPPSSPTASGLPGWTAMRQKSSAPWRSRTARTWSWRPTLHAARRDEQVRHAAAASRSARSIAAGVVADARQERAARRRPRCTAAASATPLASWIWPGPSGSPGADQLVAGRQDRDDRPPPHLDRRRCRATPAPRSSAAVSGAGQADLVAGPRVVGRGAHVRARRSPRRDSTRRRRPPSASSTGTTASAPGGIGAPVMIRTAVPGSTAGSDAIAGRDLAGQRAACPGASAARTAKPSIAELANGGTSTAATTFGSTSTRPTASASGTVSPSVGVSARQQPADRPRRATASASTCPSFMRASMSRRIPRRVTMPSGTAARRPRRPAAARPRAAWMRRSASASGASGPIVARSP